MRFVCTPCMRKVFFGSQFRFPSDKSLPTIIFQQDVIYPRVCRTPIAFEVPNSEDAEQLVANKEEEYVAGKEHIFDTPPTEDPHYIVFVQLQLFKRKSNH